MAIPRRDGDHPAGRPGRTHPNLRHTRRTGQAAHSASQPVLTDAAISPVDEGSVAATDIAPHRTMKTGPLIRVLDMPPQTPRSRTEQLAADALSAQRPGVRPPKWWALR